MDIEQPKESLDKLIEGAITSQVALPEFQRHFVWRTGQVKILLSSVARNWPIGSFLLWKPDPTEIKLAAKRISGLPEPDQEKIEWFVLDGQQRLTALIHALQEDKSETVYYIDDLPGVLEGQYEDLDEKIMSLKRHTFVSRYPTTQAQAEKGIAKISDIASDAYFDWWQYRQGNQPEYTYSELGQMRRNTLPGFDNYDIPCVVIPQDTELLAVARIFETTNRYGVRLGTVDLMTARLYPSDFMLRDKWDTVIEQHSSVLDGYAVLSDRVENGEREGNVDAEDVLRLIAFFDKDSAGITKDRILKLKPETVIAEWDQCVDALVEAIDWMKRRCGCVNARNFLPAPLMLLPVAVSMFLFRKQGTRSSTRVEIEKGLERWFWISVLLDRYGSSTNTRALGDAREFSAWISQGTVPEVLSGSKDLAELAAVVLEELLDPDGGEQSVRAGLMCIVAARNGGDWAAKRAPLVESAEAIERHHIFPSKGFPAKQWKGLNALANLTPQSRESNKELGNSMPVDHNLVSQDIAPHFVHLDNVAVDTQADFDDFCEARANEITAAMVNRAFPGIS
ncbi:MAG: DUF262 domain-containing protein [Chloroflexi bacterium]|nr:DUF262 domain-containing protein [Chloroflexota bacterium]MCY3695623.1 DUF262 domain-containing protein [Chloroflexota bacterium]